MAPWVWASPSPDEEALPPQVAEILMAIDGYQRALNRSDYVATNRAWQDVVKLWKALPESQQKHVERHRPGTTRWMESGTDYSDGGFDTAPCLP